MAPRDTVAPAIVPLRRYASVIDPSFVADYRPVSFARSVSLRSGFERRPEPAPVFAEAPAAEPQVVPIVPAVSAVVRSVPVPPSRPALLSSAERATPRAFEAQRKTREDLARVAAAPADPRSILQKLFGAAPAPNTVLAYAAPEDGGLGLGGALRASAAPDRWTAVYDIASHTVTLPDGTRLEAHSGLGAKLDDPRSVADHMRGVTPPNVYELTPREQPFHGVRALRLTPVGGTTYGRIGLLAHTYMLGPRGDSNGCVVFRDYKAFLQAYDNGAVRRLAVVARGS